MKPDKCVVLGFGVEAGVMGSSLIVSVDRSRVDLVARMGRVDRSNTSPDRRSGRVDEYFSVRISRASVNMGVVEGV